MVSEEMPEYYDDIDEDDDEDHGHNEKNHPDKWHNDEFDSPPMCTPGQFLRVIWGGDLPEGYLNVVATGVDGLLLTKSWPTTQVDDAVRWATETNKTSDVCFGIGLRGQDPGIGRRGEAGDVVAIPGFWFDLHVLSYVHTETKLPHMWEADVFLSTLPLKPTLIVESGSGLHGYWLFKKPLFFSSQEERTKAAELSMRWHTLILAAGNDRGWKLDDTSDLACALRIPGTYNQKMAPSILVVAPSEYVNLLAKYDLDDFEAAIRRWEVSKGQTVGKAAGPIVHEVYGAQAPETQVPMLAEVIAKDILNDNELLVEVLDSRPAAVVTIPPMNTPDEFLRVIWGGDLPNGWVTVFAVVGGYPQTHASHSTNVAAAVRWAIAKNHSADVWFGIGLRGEDPGLGKRGCVDDVTAIPGFWFDLDVVGPGHKETNLPPSLAEAEKFLESLPLTPTIVVYSGGGIQAYWLFLNHLVFRDKCEHGRVKDLSARWNRFIIAEGKKNGWRLDNTNDLARVLRVPGTFNRKPGNPVAVPVTVPDKHVNLSARYDLAAFEAVLPGEVTSNTVRAASVSAPHDRPAQERYPAASLQLIVPKCAWLRHCHDDAETLDEPEWFAMISILARCQDGERHCHEWSAPYKQYRPAETDAKIKHTLRDGGPRTCEGIKADYGWCDSCTETAKSPIVMGHESTVSMLPEITVPELLDPDMGLPDGFCYKSDGLYFEVFSSQGSYMQYVCSYVRVVAMTRSFDGSNWGLLLEIKDPDGVIKQVTLPKESLAGNGEDYRRELLRLGLRFGSCEAQRIFHSFLQKINVNRRVRTVSRVGWHEGVFVLPGRAYGVDLSEDVCLYPEKLGHDFGVSGTLDDWKSNVGQYCVGNSMLLFAISLGIAPSLLNVVGAEPGGFHFVGGSSCGKSTAQYVAGSVCGGRDGKGYKSSWRATSNGLEGVAVAHSDCLLCLDEIGEISSKELDKASYMLANGQGKARSDKLGAVREIADWRLLYLSSGEETLADKLSEEGKGKAMAGQLVRLVDINAELSSGLGLFENLHGDLDPKLFAERLQQGSKQYYGSPLRCFLERLVTDIEAAKSTIRDMMDDFQTKACPPHADGQVKRVCSRFALVAAAGELAVEYDIFPCNPGQVMDAVLKCCQNWLSRRGGVGPMELQNGLAQVRAFFQAHGASRFETWGSKGQGGMTIRNMAGFRRLDDAEAWEYFVQPSVFKDVIAKGHNAARLAKELARLGLLILGKTGELSTNKRIPGMASLRYYHFSANIVADNQAMPQDGVTPVTVETVSDGSGLSRFGAVTDSAQAVSATRQHVTAHSEIGVAYQEKSNDSGPVSSVTDVTAKNEEEVARRMEWAFGISL